MWRLATALLIAISLAGIAAGCGGDDEPSGAAPADEWAEDFCTTVTDWTDELQRISDEAGDPSSIDVDALEQAARDVSAATEEFVDELRALGAPDTESGENVREALESLADTTEAEQQDVEEAVDAVSDITDVRAAITAIGTSISAMGSAFQQALDALEEADVGGELETAFEQSEACDELSG